MRLREGIKARDFTVQDINGTEIKLSDYKGKRIILSFLRNVSCPFCNVRVHKLMGNNVALKKSGVQLILFFESSNEKLSSSILHKGISPWPIIGDPDKEIFKLYRVENSVVKMLSTFLSANTMEIMKLNKTLETTEDTDTDASKTLIPADFFIDENFVIKKAFYGKHLGSHISMEEIKKFANIPY